MLIHINLFLYQRMHLSRFLHSDIQIFKVQHYALYFGKCFTIFTRCTIFLFCLKIRFVQRIFQTKNIKKMSQHEFIHLVIMLIHISVFVYQRMHLCRFLHRRIQIFRVQQCALYVGKCFTIFMRCMIFLICLKMHFDQISFQTKNI